MNGSQSRRASELKLQGAGMDVRSMMDMMDMMDEMDCTESKDISHVSAASNRGMQLFILDCIYAHTCHYSKLSRV